MSCGSGKTTCFVQMAKQASLRGRRVLILVHRTELLEQSSQTLTRAGLKHGIIAPGRFGELEQVAVASVQTLHRRIIKGPIYFDFVIGDEAHRKEIQDGLRHFPLAHILGCTATPIEGMGRKHGGVFDTMVKGPPARELIARGRLVEPVIYAPPNDLDLTGVRTRDGDFVQSDVAERVNKPSITGDAVKHYSTLAKGEPAVVFCASIEHAEAVAVDFNRSGFRFEVVHGKLDKHTRKQRIDLVRTGHSHGLTSVDILTTGTDIPSLSVAMWLTATKSQVRWGQSNGRIMRTSPSKHRALILDHCGNVLTLGMPHDETEITLEDCKSSRPKADTDETEVRQCKKCFAVYEKTLACTYCGHVNPPKPRKIEEVDGELREITKAEIERAKTAKVDEYKSARSWDEMKAIAERRGDSMFWLKRRWGAKFGIRS